MGQRDASYAGEAMSIKLRAETSGDASKPRGTVTYHEAFHTLS